MGSLRHQAKVSPESAPWRMCLGHEISHDLSKLLLEKWKIAHRPEDRSRKIILNSFAIRDRHELVRQKKFRRDFFRLPLRDKKDQDSSNNE